MTVSKEKLNWYGRTFDFEGVRYFNWSASGFEFSFKGTKAVCTFVSDPHKQKKTERAWLGIFVNGELENRIELTQKKADYVIFESEKISSVKIRVMKLSEDAFGMAGFAGMKIDGELEALPQKKKKLKLEFIGDSITCGYGIDGVWEKDVFSTNIERADKSYAYLTSKKLDADYQMVSWSGIGLISKYVDPSIDLPDDEWTMLRTWPYTDKSAALRLKIEPEVWDGSRYTPDIVVINLGTNDQSFTRNKPDRVRTFINLYRALLENVHRRTPSAKICCCYGVMGQDLAEPIKTAVKLFSREFPNVKIKTVIFPVQDEKDGIAADWHPSAKTHEKMAARLANALIKM